MALKVIEGGRVTERYRGPPAERRTPPRPDLLAHSHPEAFITGHLNQQSNDGERGPTFLDGIKPVC